MVPYQPQIPNIITVGPFCPVLIDGHRAWLDGHNLIIAEDINPALRLNINQQPIYEDKEYPSIAASLKEATRPVVPAMANGMNATLVKIPNESVPSCLGVSTCGSCEDTCPASDDGLTIHVRRNLLDLFEALYPKCTFYASTPVGVVSVRDSAGIIVGGFMPVKRTYGA